MIHYCFFTKGNHYETYENPALHGVSSGAYGYNVNGIAQAKSQDISIDGDYGKLAVTLQTPDGKDEYPLVIIMIPRERRRQSPITFTGN